LLLWWKPVVSHFAYNFNFHVRPMHRILQGQISGMHLFIFFLLFSLLTFEINENIFAMMLVMNLFISVMETFGKSFCFLFEFSCQSHTQHTKYFVNKILTYFNSMSPNTCWSFWVPHDGHWGRIFSHVRPSYEWAVSNLDRPLHISLWV